MMKKQTIPFAVVKKDGIIQQIGKSSVPIPPIHFKGGHIKWYEDTKKNDKQLIYGGDGIAVGDSVLRLPISVP